MEKQQIVLTSRDGGTVSGAAPAFFVILKQQQGNGKADQGILVANRDACALASSVAIPVKPRVKTCLPADCVSGGITVTLDNNNMWNEFYHRSTEMILTKQGRRMFPYCRYWITGLNSSQKYILVMDISPVDNHRYKWNGRWWEPSGKAEPHVLGRVFIHPESPSTGQFWMHQPVSFYKLKLTNNILDQEGHIILHSMHRYLPRLHLVPANKATEVIQLNGPDVHTFTFPQTEFFAVTAYQNIQITQLKIDYNPFAKGFRDDGPNIRPQRDVKQNNNSELEGGDVFSTPGICGRPAEVDALDVHQKSLDTSFISQNPSDIELNKESFNAEGDFLGLLDSDLPSGVMPKLKQEVSESPIASSYESNSHVASPLDPNGHFNVVVKEEPVDDYDYESNICTQGITVKQEDTDEETDEYSNTDDDDPVVQKHLMRRRETDGIDGEFTSRKRMLTSLSGVAKAKMLKLDSGKMPVVYLEPCTVTKSTVKISELPQTMLSSCKKDKSPLSAILDSLPPVCFENHKDSCSGTVTVPKELVMKKESPGSKMSQKYCSIREAQWALSKSPNFNLRGSVSCDFPDKEICGRKRPGIVKNPMSLKGSGNNQSTLSSVTNKRGRPRKLKISKAGRPPKGIGKNVVASKNTSLEPGNILPDVKPDLEDVDGVLFVSFASKEALDINTVDRAGGEESQNLQAPLLTTSDPDCQARIQALEKELMEELKTLRHKQVIHPSLQEVGLKLNSVDPTMSIDLKYLGVQLPLSYSNYSLWSYPGTNPNSPDTGFSFVSRTGKTNDFTKIKGWRGKLHGASRNEGGSSEGSLKNRSAFCSDKLDEYLENEGKLMETSMGFSSNTPTSPVVYQLPTKSTSYVRTLDSVLKKQSTVIPSTSYTLKPVPPSSTSRKTKTQTRQASTNSRVKSSYKPILPSPFPPKQKQISSVSGEKAAKSASSLSNQADGSVLPTVDENTFPKQISLRQAPQHHQAPRPPGLSKSQVKLMDLEDSALWDGKPRTYITEERADISLVTLLTAQASLKSKPIHKIIRRRAPPCNNDFCRLGCICASLAQEKRQPTHCRRPDCMFGCTCLKRRVLLVKGGSKHKKMMKKAVRGNLVLFGTQGQQQEDEDVEEEGDGEEEEIKQKDRKKRKRVEYTICDSEPEQPVRNCPLWVRVEGEVDPEPIYVPTPSVIEPVKSMVLPNPEVWLPSKNRPSSGTKPGRIYTPRPNPVIREEDKDPVYVYFESLMTCARVRAYEHRREEKKQQKDKSDSQSCSVKQEQEPELQSPEKATCEVDKDKDTSRATRPSPGGVFAQFVINKSGALQQKIPGASTRQAASGQQFLSIKPTPITVIAPVVPSTPSPALCTVCPAVTAATTTSPVTVESTSVAASTVTTPCQTKAGEPPCSPPAIAVTAAPATPGISTCTTPSTTPPATVSTTKTTGIVAAVATTSFPKTVVTPPTVTCAVVTTSTSTVVLTTAAAATPVVTTLTSSAVSVPVILSGVNSSPPQNPKREDTVPQAASKTPPKIAPGTDKRVGPRLLLIPVHQTASALRPLNTQVAQRQKMVLQPLRSPGAVNLFRHPNGQIIQLVPLQQVRTAGAQPSVQPVVLRNPGSIVGIRLPAPSKPPESPVSPTSSVSSTSPAANSAVQTAVPKLSPPSNPATQASSLLPSVTSFVSQAGTLTLRISSSAVSSVTNQTASESKITCSSGGLSATTANLIPLQSGNFALLQLPGQKTVPNSILHHFASLQMKKDYRKICKKEDSGAAQQKENGKTPSSSDTEVTESGVTVPHGKQEENELSVNQSNAIEVSASGTVTPSGDRNSTILEIVEKNSKVLESSCDDSFPPQQDVSAYVISSDHSYISEKPNDEEEKGASEEKEDSVSSETVVEAVSANSVCGSSDESSVAPLDNAHSQILENRETAQLKNHGQKQTNAEWEEKPIKVEEEDAQTQMDEDNTASSGQLHSQQDQDIQVKIKEEESETELFENKQEFQGDAAQPDVERREYKGSVEGENVGEKTRSRSEIGSAKEWDNASGEEHTVDREEGKRNIARQEGSDSKEQGACDSVEEMKTGHDILTHVNSSWSKISSIVPPLENRSEVDNKADTSEKSDFLTAPEQRAHKKGYMPTIDITSDDMEEDEDEDEEEEEEEDEKTDDSADEMLDGASDFPSEEEIDVEKVDACEYREDDEQVDIETVEELSEKINIARLKATAAHIEPSDQKYHPRNSSDETLSEKHSKKHQTWKRKLKSHAEAFAHYRQTHTANERRRRNEIRGLFDKLKKVLGLLNLPKVSKCYILKQAFEEIQGLTDQADKFIGQKTLLTRKRDGLIRKVSTLSGKTEEVVLKKLEYIYAKQKATEAQKKKKEPEPQKSAAPSTASTQQEGSSAAPREPTPIPMTSRRGKPLILARRGVRATDDSSASVTLTAASVVMTPQGQVLTLKSPLVPGQVAAVPSTLLQAELKPRGVGTTMTTQPGVTSVMIQLPGSTVPVQVKGILTNSTIPITLSSVAGNPAPSTVVSATAPHSESEDSFMMPKIVNVTSLAAEAGMNLNLNRNKNCNATAAAGTPASEQSLAAAPLETTNSDNVLSEEKAKPCLGDSGGDGRNTTGPKKVFFENKDALPQLWNVSCTKEPPSAKESFSKKLCIGEFAGSQTRRKDGDSGGERLKSKELSFRKLQIKDSRIEMELRKVASAMEEADLDTSEILSSIEESDDTDETLTSLLNEITFLNQQLNDDASAMSELPGALSSDFSHKDAEARRGTANDLLAADGSSFQFGHLGGSFKELSEVPGGGGSLSPLLLHLEDDDLNDGDKNSGEPSSEADVLKIVIGTEMKNPLSNLSVTSGGNGKTVTTLSDATNVTPPVLQMKTNPEASNADKSWRPMPKLAPLGLKVASVPVDSEGQSNKVMPLLAPVVAKLASSGVKNSLPATLQEGQDNKAMPTLAPLVVKLNTTGTLPSSSAGK
ncbi:MAX gene-associated protein isoform X4 [Vidua chalybeata]|uniref:MAX gene-associated protein isoform X4 n=1 Tax=Vidua chalybeata TaxID=81927 RepID=UPI0023A8B548|nr:MAX gene-associated protein isoform X4 [Vidua chalybeata]